MPFWRGFIYMIQWWKAQFACLNSERLRLQWKNWLTKCKVSPPLPHFFFSWGCWHESPGPILVLQHLSSWNNPSTTFWGIFPTQEHNFAWLPLSPLKEHFLHIWFQLLTITFLLVRLFCSFSAVWSQSRVSKGIYFVRAAGSYTFWLQHGETPECCRLLPNRKLKDVPRFSISDIFDR